MKAYMRIMEGGVEKLCVGRDIDAAIAAMRIDKTIIILEIYAEEEVCNYV